MAISKACGEIVESSLHHWVVQSWEWNSFVPFGSLVVVDDKDAIIFGIVHQVQTGSMDPSRYPFPYQKTEEELLAQQPQIFEFLKTTFSCVTVGYKSDKSIIYSTPASPPRMHAFVRVATLEESCQFFSSDQFLTVLYGVSSSIIQVDELLLAIINRLLIFKIIAKKDIIPLMHTYSLLTSNDYRRMKLFLARLQAVVK